MAGNSYTVTQVDSVTVLDSARNPKPGYQIFFTWGGGRTSSIRLQQSVFNGLDPDGVAALRDELILAEINRMDALHG